MIIYNESTRVVSVHYNKKPLKPADIKVGDDKNVIEKIPAAGAERLILKMGIFDIKPGCGECDNKIWEIVKEDTVVKALMEAADDPDKKEFIKVLTDEEFKSIPVKEAIKIAKLTYDEALLMRWRNTDKRGPVLNAINDSLDEIRKTSKPK